MADQNDIPESEQSKSAAITNLDPNRRKAGFKEDDKVNMRVSKRVMIDGTEVTRVKFDAFTVSERRYHQSRWQYKLKDRKGLLYSEGENWFSENKLKPT